MEWLTVWGIGQATLLFSRPILEVIAKDVAKDAAKSYVGKCFQSVFSVIHQEPLTKATGRALKELLELIESELIRADVEDDQLPGWTEDVQNFIEMEEVRQAIADLFLKPGYTPDPGAFSLGWNQLQGTHSLPDFNWKYITKRFAAKAEEIRNSSPDLRETFDSLAKAQDSTALRELAGLPPDFNLETYREALVERYGNLDFASLDTTGPYYNNVRLWSVFVPQSVRECHEYDPQLLEVPKEHLQRLAEAGELDTEQLVESEKLHDERRRAYVNQPPRPVLEVVNDTTTNGLERLVILGDPGSGKSCLLQYLALEWAKIADPNQRYTAPLPLLIELRAYNRWQCPSSKGFLKYLHEASTWHRLNQQTLHHLLDQSNRVVLLLDGLDEVFDPVEREQVVNDIHRFSNDHKQVRILVNSRVVGYKPKRLRDAEFRHFMLQDLDEEQISHFLDKWHRVTFDKAEEGETKRARLDKAIKNSKSIGQLAGNPLLLTMMAILNRNQKLPDDRVDLYQQCSRLLLHQWDTERALGDFPGLSEEIGLREKTTILRTVAYAMQTHLSDNSRANYIDSEALEKLIEGYLCNELRFEQARAVARRLVEQLRQRNFILCYLGGDSYAFVHRTFLEYFCAAEIVHRFNVAKTLDIDGLIALFDKHCRDDDWREVLRLICGQIDEKFVGRIVEHLATRTDLDKWDKKTPIPELPLAIWCLSEVRNIGKLDDSTATIVKRLYEIINNRKFGGGLAFHFLRDTVGEACRQLGMVLREARHLTGVDDFDPTKLDGLCAVLWVQCILAMDGDRELIESYLQSDHFFLSAGAVRTLAALWPDNNSRKSICNVSKFHKMSHPRDIALRELAYKWPDKTTRELLIERAVQDEHEYPRSTALEMLAEKWSDETTRQLITERAVQDEDGGPRSTALRTLVEKWPDETTRQLIEQQAEQDEDEDVRKTAHRLLKKHWPAHKEKLTNES